MWVNFPINMSMTGGLMAASTPVVGGGCAGEPGSGETGGRNTKMGEVVGGRNTSNAVLLGTCSREALHKIVSSHTSTQVGSLLCK